MLRLYSVRGETVRAESEEDAAWRFMARHIRRDLHSRSLRPHVRSDGCASFDADAGGVYVGHAMRRVPARRGDRGGWYEVLGSGVRFVVREIVEAA